MENFTLRVIVRVKFYTRVFACKSTILHAIYTRVNAAMPVVCTVISNSANGFIEVLSDTYFYFVEYH